MVNGKQRLTVNSCMHDSASCEPPSVDRQSPDPVSYTALSLRDGKQKNGLHFHAAHSASKEAAGQRFEYWKLRRAPARPYFLRSTTRLSRVR